MIPSAIFRRFLSIALILFLSSNIYAQWRIVANNLFKPHSPAWGGVVSYKDGILWAGINQLFNSLDSGVTWNKISDPVPGSLITEICFLDKNIGAIAYVDHGIYITYNRGNSWTNILSLTECFSLSFARNSNELFAADRANLHGTAYYTNDGGNSWSQQKIEGNGGGVYDAMYDSRNNTAYLLSRSISPTRASHINISSDFGKTWQQQMGNVDLDCYSFALDSCDPNKVIIGNEELDDISNNLSEIYISDNSGKTWTSKAQGVQGFFSSSLSSSLNAIYAATSLGGGIFRSLDGGNTWKSIGGPSPREDTRLLCAINDNIIFAVDLQGNIWRTLNSGGDSIVAYPGGTTSSFAISSKRVDNDTLGVEMFLPIYLKAKGAMPSFDMDVHYPTASLIYRRSILPNGKIIDVKNQQWAGRSKIHFDVADLAALPDSLIGYSVFKRVPDNYDCAHVVFDSGLAIAAGTPCSGIVTLTAPPAEGIIGAPKLPTIQFTISSKRIINDSIGIIIYLPIFLKGNGVVPSFDMVMHYPPSPMTYLQSVTFNGKIVDIPGEKWVGRTKLHFDAADLAARVDSLIGFCEFKWYPYEYDCAQIPFDSIVATIQQDPCAGKPSLKASATGGIIGSFPTCGVAVEADVDAPQFTLLPNKNIFTDTLEVSDGRSTDEGLKSIKWAAETGTDTTKIVVLAVTPVVMPCFNDKQTHTISVVQLDSTVSGCYDFTFTDCIGHKSYTKICMTAHAKSDVSGGDLLRESLEANHPNPFSHITTFNYTTGNYGMVRLFLYDELGREVARIAEGIQGVGHHQIDFDGSRLANGNYVARFESGGKVVSRRVVIER